jgi:hypothetical protein
MRGRFVLASNLAEGSIVVVVDAGDLSDKVPEEAGCAVMGISGNVFSMYEKVR